MSTTVTGTAKSDECSFSYTVSWMPSCCGVGLVSGISARHSNGTGFYGIPNEAQIKSLAESLSGIMDKFKTQFAVYKNTGQITTTGSYFNSDMPGLVYAFLTDEQRKRFGVAFELAGFKTVKLEDGHDRMENTVHGPYYITSYYKVYYGETR